MDTPGHYLKQAKKSYAPGMVFSVCVKTEETKCDRTSVYSERYFRTAFACVSRKSRGRWSKPVVEQFDTQREVRKYIEANADGHRRNYVISPCASDALTLLNWWQHVEQCGSIYVTQKQRTDLRKSGIDVSGIYDIRRVVLRGRPDIFDYAFRQKRYVWLSGSQYVETTPIQLAESLGFDWENNLDDSGKPLPLAADHASLCLLYSLYFCKLASWWSDNATAPFGYTVGALSMGVLRSHVPAKTLCTHTNTEVHKLERHASYGGRASTWFLGNIGKGCNIDTPAIGSNGRAAMPNIRGPITHMDVRSMYPVLLRDNAFPVALKSHYFNVSPTDLREIAQHEGVIASVLIYSDSGEYPRRIDNNVEYPRGTFTTVLAGPEILSIRGKDRILKCHEMAVYKLGMPFKGACESLLDMRTRAEESGNMAESLFCKTLANSLGGKLAQRKGEWQDKRNMIAQREWGEWFDIDADTGKSCRFRAVAGCVQQYLKDPTGEGPYTFAFAYLTAYGRVAMRRLRESFPLESVVSQDTDGIWVLGDTTKLPDACGFSYGNSPGNLRVTNVSANARFFGPRHYYTEYGWVLSGFHSFDMPTDGLIVDDSLDINPVRSGVRGAIDRLLLVHRTSKLRIESRFGTIDEFGWWHPRFIDSGYERD